MMQNNFQMQNQQNIGGGWMSQGQFAGNTLSGKTFINTSSHRERFDGKQIRAKKEKRHVDYSNTLISEIRNRKRIISYTNHRYHVPAHKRYERWINSPIFSKGNPANAICTRKAGESKNNDPSAVNVLKWTPNGDRLITGDKNGKLTVWNGKAFNFVVNQSAHMEPIRTMEWNHKGTFFLTGDNKGYLHYWEPNLNKVKAFQAHEDKAVRDCAWAPNDTRFATVSDDKSIKIWNFAEIAEEFRLEGHDYEVISCDWHPTHTLLATGSKDNTVKLWDVLYQSQITTLNEHTAQVTVAKWNKNGNWLLTAARDKTLRLWDIRVMKCMQTFRGHDNHINAATWHPYHERLIVSGGFDGKICYWIVGNDDMVGYIPHAHKQCVWDMDWHPLGHCLASGDKTGSTKFWIRNRPGDKLIERDTSHTHSNIAENDVYSSSSRLMYDDY